MMPACRAAVTGALLPRSDPGKISGRGPGPCSAALWPAPHRRIYTEKTSVRSSVQRPARTEESIPESIMHLSLVSGNTRRRAAAGLVALAALLIPAPVASAGQAQSEDESKVILLDGAKGAEGIAAGEGSTFFAGDLATGDIYRGDIHKDTAKKFIDAPDGRVA